MEELDDLTGLVYEAGLRPEPWDDVLDGLRAATPCVVASLYSHDRIARTPTFDRVRGADEAGLVEIGNVPSVAAALHVSVSTVHTHVKSLFAKTATSRQAELVGLLSSLADPINPDLRGRRR